MQENYSTYYRKFRPLVFSEVVGQDAIIKTIQNEIKYDKISHAYLFCGTRGTGKTTVAKILSRSLNCTNRQNENPCNECDICKSILDGNNLDVIEIDAASNNGIDDVRTIIEHIEYPPTASKYKIFIIDEVHMLSNQAFNALLKTLEEPPSYAIFILATTEPQKIPDTIKSRCQRFDFKRISIDIIKEKLEYIKNEENINISEEAISFISLKADGSLRDAISLFDKVQSFSKNEEITYDKALEIIGSIDTKEWKIILEAIKNEDLKTCILSIKKYMESGKEVIRFASDLLWYVRSLLFCKKIDSCQDLLELSKENYEATKEESEKFLESELIFYIDELSKLINKLRYEQEKRIILESTIIRLCKKQTNYSYEALVARVENLENAIINNGNNNFINLQKNEVSNTNTNANININANTNANANANTNTNINYNASNILNNNISNTTNNNSSNYSNDNTNSNLNENIDNNASNNTTNPQPQPPNEENNLNNQHNQHNQHNQNELILNKIINEWDTFVGLIKLEHITKELLRLCKIEKIENDFTKLKIVCDSKLSYGRISSNENKIKIKEATKEKYNIEIDYYVETKDIIENENTIYATKEDFDQIDFPIETE